ncbi:mucin-16-like [Mesocricetus auratus]|uniref:Mucin-16-like n=1 Tax=Mesocricetus auratus TaxID=10036 RepID=A0ABM2WSK8_MESAU|nr:mucin-16-like [Mesocricetus auratus]
MSNKPKPTLPSYVASTLQEPHSSTGSMASVLRATPKTSTRMLDTSTTVTSSTLFWRSSIPSNLATLKNTRSSQKAVNSLEDTSSDPHISSESIVPKTTLSTLIPEATGKSSVSVSVNASNSTSTDTHNGAELNTTMLSDTSRTLTMVETNIPEVISTTEPTPSPTKVSFINSVVISSTKPTYSTSYSSPHQSIKPEETSSEMSTGPPNSITSTEITTSETGHDVTPNMVSQSTVEKFSLLGMLSSVSQTYPLLERSSLHGTSYDTPSKTKSSALEGIIFEHSLVTTVRTNSSSPVNSASPQSDSHSFAGSMNSSLPITHHTTKQVWNSAWMQSSPLENMDLTTRYGPNHTNVSLPESWTRDMSVGNTSFTKLHESSKETSIGITIGTPVSSITMKSQQLTNSHTGYSVVTSNIVTSKSTSTYASIKDTFTHSKATASSNSIASETFTPISWEEAKSPDSITMPHEPYSPSAIYSMKDTHIKLSTSSMAPAITISKNLIPTDLSTSLVPGTDSIPSLSSSPQTSFNIAQSSNISEMTSVSSVTKGNHMEDGAWTFLLSESTDNSSSPPSPSWTHSTWEGTHSTRPMPQTASHFPVPSNAKKYNTSSPASVTSIFIVAKDPIPTRLLTTSGSVTQSIPSSNTAQLSKISQTTSVSSFTPANTMEGGSHTPHVQHNITSTSVPPEKETFTTILPTMEHTRFSPSQPISSESMEIETGTLSSPRTAWADFNSSEDIKPSPSHSGLPTSPSLFESRTSTISAESTSLSAPHQSSSEDTSTGNSISLPTSTISVETEEMTNRPMGQSPVTSDILTYPDTSSTDSVKDIHTSGMHSFPHSESMVPFNSPASASWTFTPRKGSMSTDSTTPGLLSLTPDASLPERHSSHSPDSVASVFTVTRDLFPTASHTSSDPVTAYSPSWSSISESRSNTGHYFSPSQMNKFSSVTPEPKMEASSSGPQFKYTITPTSVSSENIAFPTTPPTIQVSPLSLTQSTSFDHENIGTQKFTLLTTLTQTNIPEVNSSTDFISSHSEMPFTYSLPVSRTVSMSPDSTALPTLQHFIPEDISSGIVSSNITESEELYTSKTGDSKVTSNMVLSLEASPMSSVSDNLTSFLPTPLVTETSTFLSQSYEDVSVAKFPALKGSQPADSPGYLYRPTLTSPVTSTVEHSTPSPSSVVSAFTTSREAITTGKDIHDLSTSFPNWSSSIHSSQETSQATKFSQTSSASSLKAEMTMEARTPIMTTGLSISEYMTADRISTKNPPYFSASEDITTGSIPSHITYPSTKEELATIFEAGNSGSLLYETLSRDTATTVSMTEFSSPEPQTSPHLALISEHSSFDEQSHISSLPKEKHTSSDSVSTVTEKTSLSPVTSTSQVQNVSSLGFVGALVTSIQETTSIGKDKNIVSKSTSIQGLDATRLSTLGPSYDIRNLKTSHIFSNNPSSRVETNILGVNSQDTILDNSGLSRITAVIMTSQNNEDATLSTPMFLSESPHRETQKAFPLTSVKQEFTMPEYTNLMTRSSSDLYTVPTRISTGLSRTETNSNDGLSVSSSASFTKTTDISTGTTSNVSTLPIPNIDISQVINATESSKITTLWKTSGTTSDTQAFSTVTQTVLNIDNMSVLNSSESLSRTDSPSHEATSSVNFAEIHQTTSHFPATSTSEGQRLSSQRTAKDTNLAYLTTLFPSWKNGELTTSKDTRTSQTSYMFTRTEVTSMDIPTPRPQFQNTAASDAVSPDGTSSSLLISPTKTLPYSASSLSPQSSNSTSLPEMSFPTSGFSKTTDTLSGSLETETSLPPNLNSTSLEISGLPQVTTDTEKFQSSSQYEVTSMKIISTGHELSSSVPAPPVSSRDTYTMGASSYIWVTAMSTSFPDYLETTRSDTEQFSHLTSGLRDSSMSLQTNIPSRPVSTLILPESETTVTSAMNISTPYQTLSSKFTETPVESATILHPSSSTVESTVATSFSESNFTMPSPESTYVPQTSIDETTFVETTTFSSKEEITSFATTSISKGNSSVTLSSPHSITQSSHVDVLVSTIAERLSSSTSTPLFFSASTGGDFTASPVLHGITSSGNLQTEDNSIVIMSGSTQDSMIMFGT